MLNNLKCLSSTATSIVGTLRTADKEVQTDFPSELLEDYVVNNRKRILKLLGKKASFETFISPTGLMIVKPELEKIPTESCLRK